VLKQRLHIHQEYQRQRLDKRVDDHYDKYSTTNSTEDKREVNDNVHNSPNIPFKFSVLSYNLWNFSPHYKERMGLITDQIRKLQPDIVGLQEVRYSNHEYPLDDRPPVAGFQLEDLVSELDEYQFVYQPGMSYFRVVAGAQRPIPRHTEEGVAILSRYPIVETNFVALSRNFSDIGDEHQRVCLSAVVDTPGGYVSVASTHLSLSDTARKRNIVEVYDLINTLPYPRILLGDFNENFQSLSLDFFRGKYPMAGTSPAFKDAWSSFNNPDFNKEKEKQGWTYITIHEEPKKIIDFILFEGKQIDLQNCYVVSNNNHTIVLSDNETLFPSDHRALMATFQFKQ